MHIPLSRYEIAEFLETTPMEIEQLWATGKLKRSLCNEVRPIPSLAQSSIFDVAEHALSSNHLPITLSPAEAAMWVLYLCELCEYENWAKWTQEYRAASILAYATDDGLAELDDSIAAKTAAVVIVTHSTLINICHDRERKFALERTPETTGLLLHLPIKVAHSKDWRLSDH